MSSSSNVTNSNDPNIIVIDAGSGYIKAGWAGEDSPRIVIPNVAINLSNQSVPASVSDTYGDVDWVFGNDALAVLHLASDASAQHHLHTIRPVERGIIKDWDTYLLIIEYVIQHHLHVRDTAQHPIFMVQNPNTRPQCRIELARLLFKTFSSPSLVLQNSSSVGVFSTGRTTALAIDIGETLTTIVPIFEGFALLHALQVLPIGGADITRYLIRTMVADTDSNITEIFQNENTSNLSKLHVASTQKEVVGFVLTKKGQVNRLLGNTYTKSLPSIAADTAADGSATVEFFGHMLHVSAQARSAPAECLFRPSLLQTAKTNTSMTDSNAQMQPRLNTSIQDEVNRCSVPSSFVLLRPDSKETSAKAHASTPIPLSLSSLSNNTPLFRVLGADLASLSTVGLADAAVKCIEACDNELKQDLIDSIVIFGGTSLLNNLTERIEQDQLEALGDNVPVKIVTDSQRHYASWIGASMLASQPTVNLYKTTPVEFQEDPTLIHKRYF